MTTTEKVMVAFLGLLLTCCLALGGALIWLNATAPGHFIEACPVSRVKP